MTPLEANLAALRTRWPRVADALASAPERSLGEWTRSRSGRPVARRGGVSLVSPFDPEAEAARAVPTWDDEVDFALLPGLGLGYLAAAVTSGYPDLPLVVADDDPSWVREVLTHIDLSALWSNPRVTLLVGPDSGVVGQFFGGHSCRTVVTLGWRPLVRFHPGWEEALADQVAQAQARARANVATDQRFGALWRRNLAKNEAQAEGVRPLSALANRWAGAPAVVAAAGPSLGDCFPWIQAHRHQMVLIAVDTAWPALAAQGLEPDLLVVLDGQYWNSRHVDRPVPGRTLVVTEWVGPPRAFRLAPGRTFVAASSVPLVRPREAAVWGPLGTLPSGGSVATAAFSLALLLGASEVAFAGLDLGYPRGQTHVAGSQFEESIHRRARRLVPAETLGLGLREGASLWRPAVDGGQVRSDHRMDLYRAWLEDTVAAHPEVRVVNLGRRGSLIRGMGVPSEGYGVHWKPLSSSIQPLPPPLGPRAWASSGRWVLDETNLESTWAQARAFWGPEVWEPWASRAWNTWTMFPSHRSRRGVWEVLRLAHAWAEFLADL